MAGNLLKVLLVAVIFLGDVSPILACLWDYDTLAMERKRFPNALELITGKFLRHSNEFYEWRVKDRLKQLKDTPDKLALYDDLAVAYDKLGKHEDAIATIQKKDVLKPGLYETEANLGTFLIHSGKLKEGLVHIGKAIEINPDAHFGREIYQKLLVEYVLSKKGDNGELKLPLYDPLKEKDGPFGFVPTGFAKFVIEQQITNRETAESKNDVGPELQKALKGVLGMMRFGHHDSPILLEAVGDLLLAQTEEGGDAKRLAARAYLKASYEVDNETAKAAYRALAEQCLEMQTAGRGHSSSIGLKAIEASFRKELREADKWYKGVCLNEQKWIKSGKNVDEEFSKKYYEKPEVSSSTTGLRLEETPKLSFLMWLQDSAFAAWVFALTSSILAFYFLKLISKKQKNDSNDQTEATPA